MNGSTLFSVDSVLYSREVDPAELLMDLGFGGRSSDILARIPARFFQPSMVTDHFYCMCVCIVAFSLGPSFLLAGSDMKFDKFLALTRAKLRVAIARP